MRSVLHIIIREDPLAAEVIEAQKSLLDVTLDVVRLEPASVQPLYEQLLEKIFSADTIAIW